MKKQMHGEAITSQIKEAMITPEEIKGGITTKTWDINKYNLSITKHGRHSWHKISIKGNHNLLLNNSDPQACP